MLFHAFLRRPVAGLCALIAFAATSAAAGAADVTVTDAKIEAGKLVIAGTTAAPNTWVRLDGQTSSAFNVKSDANRAFGFAIVYHPGDCIVGLQKLISPTSLGEATDALVANCGPQGLVARGAWSGAANYQTNDLVTSLGSSWRAKRNNVNRAPATNAADWEQFAAMGATGPAGPQGPAGSNFASLAPPTGPAGGALTGTYPNPGIANLAVTTARIAVGAVTNNRIGIVAVTADKIATGAVTVGKIAPNAINEHKIADGAVGSSEVLNESLTADELASNSVGSAEIQTDSVNATEIANDSIDSGEIVDFGLSNQDVGVLFAQVNANGTLANSSGSVTVTKLGGLGTYEVDFGRNVSACAPIVTQGEAGTGGAAGGITGATDRTGNAEAFFVTIRTDADALVDRAFHLVVVC